MQPVQPTIFAPFIQATCTGTALQRLEAVTAPNGFYLLRVQTEGGFFLARFNNTSHAGTPLVGLRPFFAGTADQQFFSLPA